MNNERNTKKILLKIDEKLHKQLKIDAINEGTTLHQHITNILNKQRKQ